MTKSLLLFFLLSVSFASFSQTIGAANKATVDNTVHFTLSATSDVNNPYALDIKALVFKDAATAESFFGGISDNLLTYTYDRVNKNVILKLNIYPGSTMTTVSKWNTYISSNTSRYMQIYKEISK